MFGRDIDILFLEKFERIHLSHQNKLIEIGDLKDREYADKIKRFEERIRNLDADISRANEDLTAQKSKHNTEKRQFLERESEIEAQIRKQEVFVSNMNPKIINIL